MKIELSPLVISASTYGSSQKRRRRRRAGDVLASFVVPIRQKPRNKRDEVKGPLLTVSSPHRVTLLEHTDGSLQESSDVQIASRPSKACSFVCEDFPVPAISDGSRVYALQSNNAKLISYLEEQEIHTVLESPALSLSLLHLPTGSLVYGSCHDGRVFVASHDHTRFSVDYIHFEAPSSHIVPVGVKLQVAHENSSGKGVDRKRKLSSADECQCRVFQCLSDGHVVYVVRKVINITQGKVVQSSSDRQQTISVPLADSQQLVSDLQVSDNLYDAFTIMYSTKLASINGKKHDPEHFFVSLSLKTGTLIVAPVALPVNTVWSGLVGPSLLAVATSDQDLCVYDSVRGALLHRERLDLMGADAIISMECDVVQSRIALVVSKDDSYLVGWIQVMTDGKYHRVLQREKLSLAFGLESAIPARSTLTAKNRYILNEGVGDSIEFDHSNDSVRNGLKLLDGAFEMVRVGSAKVSQPNFLRQVFCSAVEVVFPGQQPRSIEDNPQDSTPSVKKRKSSVANGVNGLKNCIVPTVVYLPTDRTPQDFVDVAVSSVVDLLCFCDRTTLCLGTVEDDLRWVLQQLVRCGQVSARIHFGTDFLRMLESLENTSARNGPASYSAFELIMDTFRNCSDLSEQHMVSALRYVLTTTRTSDLAEYFVKTKSVDVNDHFRDRCAQFSAASARKKIGKSEGEMKERQIVLSCLMVLLSRVATFSEYNESLLRHALEDKLGQEGISFLCRSMMSMVSEPDRFGILPPVNGTKKRLKLLSILSTIIASENCSNVIGDIQKWLSREIKHHKPTLMVEQAIKEAYERKRAKRAKKVHQADEERKYAHHSVLPAYQIERLVF